MTTLYLMAYQNHYHAPGARWGPTSDTDIDETFGWYDSESEAQEQADLLNVRNYGTASPSIEPSNFPIGVWVIVPVERA